MFPSNNYIEEQIGKEKFEFIDKNHKKVKVTYNKEGKIYDRYYYLFEEQEISSLCEKVGFEIEKVEKYEANLYLILN